jgi:uncharacterized protein (UPF0261 family)
MPKVIVSTVASGRTESYIGTSDMILFPSIVDICGINGVSRVVLSNAGAAFSGMVVGRLAICRQDCSNNEKFTVGLTMFGVTTPCVNAVKERLAKEGYETMVFHATGVGGRASSASEANCSSKDLILLSFLQEIFKCFTHCCNSFASFICKNPWGFLNGSKIAS